MKEDSVAKKYATALYDVLKTSAKQTKAEAELEAMLETVQNEEFLLFLEHPKFQEKEKFNVITKAYKGFGKEVVNLLKILVQAKRVSLLSEVVLAYKALCRGSQNVLVVEVITAVSLEKSSRDKLTEKLKKKYNCKIELDEKIDERIIGGIKLVVGDTVIDGSVLHTLQTLKNTLE